MYIYICYDNIYTYKYLNIYTYIFQETLTIYIYICIHYFCWLIYIYRDIYVNISVYIYIHICIYIYIYRTRTLLLLVCKLLLLRENCRLSVPVQRRATWKPTISSLWNVWRKKHRYWEQILAAGVCKASLLLHRSGAMAPRDLLLLLLMTKACLRNFWKSWTMNLKVKFFWCSLVFSG